jgi:hypothetical protein
MFGDRQYLDMFIELYAATMRHMKVLGCCWAEGAPDTAVLVQLYVATT